MNYKLYCNRFHILMLFSLLSFLNAFMWITFSPIEELTRNYYGMSDTAVNMLSVVFMILFLPGSILSSYLINVGGLRRSICTGQR